MNINLQVFVLKLWKFNKECSEKYSLNNTIYHVIFHSQICISLILFWFLLYFNAAYTGPSCSKRGECYVSIRGTFIRRLCMIMWVNIVLNRTVVVDSDWHFDNLCGSHLASQSELHHISWRYYTLWKLHYPVDRDSQ